MDNLSKTLQVLEQGYRKKFGILSHSERATIENLKVILGGLEIDEEEISIIDDTLDGRR